MSFGGYGVAGLDTGALATLRDYTIATTDHPRRPGATPSSRRRRAPDLSEQQIYDNGLRYEDLVRAADVVVTKPGYGIISEAIANDTALLYTSRGHFAEYDVLVREMPRYLRAEFIEQKDLLAGDWGAALERAARRRPPPPVETRAEWRRGRGRGNTETVHKVDQRRLRRKAKIAANDSLRCLYSFFVFRFSLLRQNLRCDAPTPAARWPRPTRGRIRARPGPRRWPLRRLSGASRSAPTLTNILAARIRMY